MIDFLKSEKINENEITFLAYPFSREQRSGFINLKWMWKYREVSLGAGQLGS